MSKTTIFSVRICGALAASLMLWTVASAQTANYPNRPIRVIVANAPGGGLDVLARLLAPTLTAALGQQLVIDNRAGATGSVAAELTAKSPPDGYTVMVGAIGNLAVNPHIYKGLGYDPGRDFAPITFAVSGSNVLAALLRQGLKTAPGTPEAFGAYMKSEYRKWGKLIAESGIVPSS